jgi:hypothetical protein
MLKRIVAIAVVVTWAVPATASATIVLNRGVFGVRIGATMKQVRRKLGGPSHVDRSRTNWFYRRRHLTVAFDGPQSRVSFLSTTNPGQRTVRGVGVGSSKRDVLQLVPGVRCGRPQKTGTDCFLFADSPTLFGLFTDTDFRIGAKRIVDEVDIGVY